MGSSTQIHAKNETNDSQITGTDKGNKRGQDTVVQDTRPKKTITIVDNSQLSYLGEALDLDATSDEAKWRITRTSTNGNETTVEVVGTDFDQILDDRESLFPEIVLSNPASLLFDGSNEYINLGDNYDFGPAQAFSWSFWMKAANFSSQRAFIAKTTQDANVYGYSFQHNSSGKLFAQFRASGTLRNYTASTTLSAGTWYHICFTYAGGSNMNGLTAYIDASAEASPSSASLNDWSHSQDLMIARRGTSFHFSGNMNQISVWNKELSSAEVTELYNSGSPGNLNNHSASANLDSWWYLNDNSNFPTETDQIGSVNGTLTNMESDDYDDGDVP